MNLFDLLGDGAPSSMPAPSPSPTSVEFRVVGDPAAQGSKMAFVNPHTGRAAMRDMGGVRLKAWRNAVADAARDAADGHTPLDGALWMVVTFRFAMPASRGRAARLAGIAHKSTAPDLDKLIRSTGDALKTSGLIRDDARFARIHADKVEMADGWLGATIVIHPLEAL